MEHFYCMDTDELEPVLKPKGVDFDTLSIEELNEYILDKYQKDFHNFAYSINVIHNGV